MDELEEYNCRVANCESNQISNPELYFHSLPNDDSTRELWLNACNITDRNNELLKSFKICEKHFDKSQYSHNYQLVQGCVPNVSANKISEMTPVSICTLDDKIKQCIYDNNIKKFNVSSSNTKLTHLLLVLNEFKTRLVENIYSFDENPPDQNSDQLESINLSTFPIPDELSETVDGSNKLIINKLTETGDEIKMTIKSSKRMTQIEKPAVKPPITYDFTRICRICLENGELKNIFEEKIDDIVVEELLKRYTSFMMLETSNLPQDICEKCLNDLKQTHDLFKKIDQSGTIFQNRLRLYPLESSDMLSYAQKYFSEIEPVETPVIQPETEPDTQPDIQPDIDTDVQAEVLPEENETLVDLEPDRTIEQIMDIDCIDNIDESNSDEFICLKCEESYENFLLLSKHMCGFTPESAVFLSEYNCNFCKTPFTSYNKFSTHLCYVKKTKNQLDSQEHRKEFTCQVCQEVFPSNSLYLYHRKLYKHDISCYCYECNVNFVTRTAFRKHKRTFQHTNEKKCLYCKQIMKASNFKAHILEHECFPCKICGLRFYTERKHKKHYLSHLITRQNLYIPGEITLPVGNRIDLTQETPLSEFPKSFPEWTNSNAPSITNKSFPAGTITNAPFSITNEAFPGGSITNESIPGGTITNTSPLITNKSFPGETITNASFSITNESFPGGSITNESIPGGTITNASPLITNKTIPAGTITNASPLITNKSIPGGSITKASPSVTNNPLPFPGRIISNIKTPLGSKLHSLLTQKNIENISEPIEDLLRIHFPGRVINNSSLPIKNKYKLNIITMNDSTK